MANAGSNSIRIACPQCLNTLTIPGDHGGQRIECPRCGRSLLVPPQLAASGSAFDDLFEASAVAQPRSTSIQNDVTAAEIEILDEIDANQTSSQTAHQNTHQAATKISDGFDPFGTRHAVEVSEVEGGGTDFSDLSEDNAESTGGLAESQQNRRLPEFELDDVKLASSDLGPDGELPLVTPISESALQPAAPVSPMPLKVEQGAGEDSDVDLNLELPGLEGLSATTSASTASGGSDPFVDDPDRPLRIEGISPEPSRAEMIGIRCGVCDTLIYVSHSQIGHQVKCPECFSQVLAKEAPLRRSSSNPWNKLLLEGAPAKTDPGGSDDSEFKLSAPVERPKLDIPANYGLESGDKDLLAPLPPQPTNPAQPTDESGPYEGGMPAQRLPASFGRAYGSRASDDEPAGPKETPTSAPVNTPYWQYKPVAPRPQEEIEQEKLEQDPLGLKLGDLGSFTGGFSKWLAQMSGDFELWVRCAIAAGAMGFGYWMFDFIWSWWDPDSPTASYAFKILFVGFIGLLAYLPGVVVLAVTASLMFVRGAEKHPRYKEWPGYNWSDWGSSVVFVLFSFWLSSLPGVLVGLLLATGTGNPIWVGILGSMSVSFLIPPLLACAVFNQSPMQVFSPRVFKHFGFDDTDWLRFLPGTAIGLGLFLLGTLLLLIPHFAFSFIGAMIQVIGVVVFASLTGLYARLMSDKVAAAPTLP